ncbi:erythromycin esterase family protein [Amycolatopsis balhimycina DSM 5908]|uniref:Erythromycin esterase family protein n=1 Tax=Amycolatopsis balhimycina DSM 5908 TaxID=1081091 RepID=A0A428W1N3_AMYBA|nr:erythromycin esterase family protein [Amycolatopsis balhimycina]RSM36966.1 erythromycin esterase family protein [Amycolatopsis balhimycina DSM 5908]
MPEPDPISVTAIADLIGDAEVVAIGENNHHIREFGVLRDRLLRHLVTECGFTVLGFEGGFPEGHLVDDWLRGGDGDVADIARDGFTFGLGDSAEVHEMLTWLRGRGVRFSGLDVPSSAGSPVPALQALRSEILRVDPANASLVDNALSVCEPYASVSSAIAPGRYGAMSVEARDAATTALTVLKGHVESLAPVYGEVAAHHAEGALRVDLYLRELDALMAGRAPEPQSSSRDTYMAATVRLLRRQFPGEKIVLMLHNGHLQRVPFSPMPGMTVPSAGTHLAAELGDRYFALALTAVSGTTTGLEPDPASPLGFRMFEQALGEPAEGSVEAAVADQAPCLVTRPAAAGIRHAHLTPAVDVAAAFDAVVCLEKQETIYQGVAG